MKRAERIAWVVVLAWGVGGCTLEPYTHESSANLGSAVDEPALSTALDRRDVHALFDAQREALMASAWVRGEASEGAVTVMPMRNRTSEHIRPQLEALIAKLETELVRGGVEVVSRARRDALVRQMEGATEPELGRMVGARYVLTGKVFDEAERTASARRVRYAMFMQLLDVESGAIVWQHESSLSKLLGAMAEAR